MISRNLQQMPRMQQLALSSCHSYHCTDSCEGMQHLQEFLTCMPNLRMLSLDLVRMPPLPALLILKHLCIKTDSESSVSSRLALFGDAVN